MHLKLVLPPKPVLFPLIDYTDNTLHLPTLQKNKNKTKPARVNEDIHKKKTIPLTVVRHKLMPDCMRVHRYICPPQPRLHPFKGYNPSWNEMTGSFLSHILFVDDIIWRNNPAKWPQILDLCFHSSEIWQRKSGHHLHDPHKCAHFFPE